MKSSTDITGIDMEFTPTSDAERRLRRLRELLLLAASRSPGAERVGHAVGPDEGEHKEPGEDSGS